MVAVVLSIPAMIMSTTKSESHCFSRWRYPWAQHCGGVPLHGLQKQAVPDLLPPEQIRIEFPPLDFTVCPEGDERLRGIAKLRALNQ